MEFMHYFKASLHDNVSRYISHIIFLLYVPIVTSIPL